MVNMLSTIEAKSDQLNSDDLQSRPITVKITKVSGSDNKEQPIAINYEGDNNKPYKPCKSMRRVLVHVWGPDGSKYVGRSMTLYRDEKVRFGGIDVGGIRISHVSDIDEAVTMALTASKANKKPFTVQPLKTTAAPKPVANTDSLKDKLTIEANKGDSALKAAWEALSVDERKVAASFKDELKDIAAKSFNNIGEENVITE